MRKAQFRKYCTVRTAEQHTQQRTADAINTAVGSRGRAQRAAGAVCGRLCALYDAYCVHRACVRIHALCALRLPACCSHSSLLLPRRAATRSQLVSKQPLALPAGSACARVPARKEHKGCRTAGCRLKRLLSSAEKLHPQAQPIGCKGHSNGHSKGNSAKDVACAPLYPQATAKATAKAGQCSAAGQCTKGRAQAMPAVHASQCTNGHSNSKGKSNSTDRPEVAKGVEAFSWREWEDYSLHPPKNF